MHSDIAQHLVGSWRLVSYRLTGSEASYPLGEDAHGLIIYTGDGHMSVQISAPGRSPYTDGEVHGGTGVEQAGAAHGYLAYAGTYTVTDDIVEHHVEHSLFPNWENTILPRRATLDENHRLHLALVKPVIVNGQERGGVLTWER
ncbi:lipocalin-like domain-containing protein [Streptomyces sp. 5-10]|uniref:lipocalin-like domain-containing protein n=1 Tax=Streptomyces sp. 5-10 TaxID=878925 RepID=UPI00168A6A0C|nr:lipocalin-like domain-containing protein [Streptomyces sp. 5-10]MBD3010869.1 lipocalin-like domain-containing protein [Streptomyces sp. 5-10]